jgi:hypothetical protein
MAALNATLSPAKSGEVCFPQCHEVGQVSRESTLAGGLDLLSLRFAKLDYGQILHWIFGTKFIDEDRRTDRKPDPPRGQFVGPNGDLGGTQPGLGDEGVGEFQFLPS